MAHQPKILNEKDFVDIRDLSEKERKILFEFIDFLRNRREKIKKKTLKRKVRFREWNLKVTSELSRKEIYESL